MKKKMMWILVSLLVVSMCGLTACGNKPQEGGAEPETGEAVEEAAEEKTEETAEEAGTGTPAGGWTVADSTAADLPEEVSAALDKAFETLTGSFNEVTPIAYIGRQVVAGTNYAVLCRVTYADDKAPAGLVVLTVYEDLQGNAELLSSGEFQIADYNTGEEAPEESGAGEPLSGGWQTPEEITSAAIPEDAQAAFDKAAEGLTGNDLTPMALLGTQVVAGTNYAFLCRSKLVTAEPVESIQVVIVYADLEGGARITGIKTVDVGSYVNY